MKLIATAKISEWLLPGQTFELPDHEVAEAETLIAGGLARRAEPETPATAPSRRLHRRRDMQAEGTPE